MDDAIFDREDMVGIGVQASTGQECIELIQVLALEENDGRAVGRNVPGLRIGAYRVCAKKQRQDADLLIARANTQGEWGSFETHSYRRDLRTASMFVLFMEGGRGLFICSHSLFLAA